MDIEDYVFKCYKCDCVLEIKETNEESKEIYLICLKCSDEFDKIELDYENSLDDVEELNIEIGHYEESIEKINEERLHNCQTNLERIQKQYEILYNE